MIDLVKKMLGIQPGGNINDEKTGPHPIHVATCALLLEIAHIDGKFTEDERHRIVSAFHEEYGLDHSEIEAIMDAAKSEVKRSIDLWQFTSIINQNYPLEEKIRIIEMIWKVIYTDGKLDKYEDYLVHNLADLLRLDHSELIKAKLKAKQRITGCN